MSTQIILKVLALRHRLRQRDRWTRPQLEEHQDRALHRLRGHAYARSPFYWRFHKGVTDRPLDDLPILTKEMVMEHFDEIVTDPTVRLADVEAHLATLSGGDELFNGRHRVASTSGSTGRRGLFLWDPDEWATILASYNRSFDWAGVGAGLTHRTKMAVVSSTTPWHQSARVGASVSSPWVPTLRLDSGDPLESIVERLTNIYVDMLEQLAGYYKETKELQESIRLCYRILEKDLCHERGHLLLTECYAFLGSHSRAYRQHRLFVDLLKSAHGVEPSVETKKRFRYILEAPSIGE